MQLDELWRRAEAEISHDYARLWTSKKFCDLTIVCAKGQELSAHKLILAARSPVFSAMFEHDTKEAQEGKIVLSDTPVEVFSELLYFLYTGKVQKLQQYAPDLLVIADKYQVDLLKEICEEFICSKVSTESVHSLLVLADQHQAPKLKAKALDYIRKNTSEIIDTLFDTNNAEALLEGSRDLTKKTGFNINIDHCK